MSHWHAPITVAIGLQGLAFVLWLPGNTALDRVANTVLGVKNAANMLGCVCLVLSLALFACAVLSRLGNTKDVHNRINQLVVFPVTVGLSLLVACFFAGNRGVHAYDFLDERTGGWRVCYWLLVVVLCGYLLLCAMRGLAILRTSTKHRSGTAPYLAAMALLSVALGAQALSVIPAWDMPWTNHVVWWGTATAMAGFALVSAKVERRRLSTDLRALLPSFFVAP